MHQPSCRVQSSQAEWELGVVIGYIPMFLNLKSKRVETALQTHLKAHNHPKTQRDERPERTSKEHGERPHKKQLPNAMVKKQTASTALTTMQPGSSYANVAHHYVIHRLDSSEKEPDAIAKSVEKLDSQRSQRIANAYRKIKKNDISERVVTEEPFDEPPRKSNNRTHYPLNKKEIVTNFANNYIAITEADELDSRRERTTEREVISYFARVIDLLLQAFRTGKAKSPVVKFRSLSSKEIELSESLERNKKSNKNLKSRSKPLQGTQNSQTDEETFEDLLDRFRESLARAEERTESLAGDQWMQVNVLVRELYAEMDQFMRELHGRCMTEMELRYSQYEKGLEIVVMEQDQMQQYCKHLEEALAVERNRTNILAQSLEEMHNKTLYCSAFFNQVSFTFDLDSFLREKIGEFAGDTSIISSRYHSNPSLTARQEFLDVEMGFQKQKKKA